MTLKVKTALYGITLSLATLFLALITWGICITVENGLSASMMGFEQEPVEGYAHWRQYFIKQSLPGNLVVGSMVLALGIILAWRWKVFFVNLHKVKHPS